jgi:uncharacterized protein YeaO (DUF488 family)
MILVKRVYDDVTPTDGSRVLVDRLWPRGLPKETAGLDLWERTVAPSDQLRMWYAHVLERYPEFARRYRAELADEDRSAALERLAQLADEHTLTLLTATRDPEHSQAEVIKEVLMERAQRSRKS